MKKIVTLFCALSLMLGLNAMPQIKPSTTMKPAGLREMKMQLPAEKLVLPTQRTHKRLRNTESIAPARAAKSAAAVTVDFAQAAYLGSYSEIVGDWEIDFYSGNDWVGFVFFNSGSETQIAGQYTLAAQDGQLVVGKDTLDVTGGTLKIAYSKEGTNYPAYTLEANFTMSDGSTVSFTTEAEVFAFDYYMAYLYMMFGMDEATAMMYAAIELEDAPFIPTGDTIQVAITEPATAVYTAEYGDYQIVGGDPAQYYVSLDIYTDNLAGTYTKADFDTYYSYIGYVRGSDTTVVDMKDANAVIAQNGSNYNLEAYYTGKDGNVYHITMTFSIDSSLPYDSDNGDVTDSFTDADQVEIYDYVADYGTMDLYVTKADNSACMYIDFYVDVDEDKIPTPYIPEPRKHDTILYLPAKPYITNETPSYTIDPIVGLLVGDYTIDYTQTVGTCDASYGVSQNYVTPSYYSTIDAEGYLSDIYMMVSGTAKVEAAGNGVKITIAAKNSHGHNVNLTYTGKVALGVEQIVEDSRLNASTQKVMHRGQMMIIRNGRKFNMTGAEMR